LQLGFRPHNAIWKIGGRLGKVTSMERFYDGRNCMKTFKVSSVTKRSAEIPETRVTVTCPVCKTPNTITFAQGIKFIVTQSK
jgi:hypothetical protein